MDIKEALARAKSWASSPGTRPDISTVRQVAAVLVENAMQQDQRLSAYRLLALGRVVHIQRGNPLRGPDTGAGYGRLVKARIVGFGENAHDVRCTLLEDDGNSVGGPSKQGEEGQWCLSQVKIE